MGKGRRRWERHHPERAARMNAEVEYWNKRCNERNEDQKLARNQAADELSTRAEALDSLRTYNELWKPETFIERTLKRNFSEFNSQNAEEVVRASTIAIRTRYWTHSCRPCGNRESSRHRDLCSKKGIAGGDSCTDRNQKAKWTRATYRSR